MNPNKISNNYESQEVSEYTFTKEMIEKQREEEIEERGRKALSRLKKKGTEIDKRSLDKEYDSIKTSEWFNFSHYQWKSFLESMPKNKNELPLTQEDKIEMGLLEIINKEGGEGALFDRLVSLYMPKGIEYERQTKSSPGDSDRTYEGVKFYLSPSKSVEIWGDGLLSMHTYDRSMFGGGIHRGLNPARVVLDIGRMRSKRDTYEDPRVEISERDEEYTFDLEESDLLVTSHYIGKCVYGWARRGAKKSEWLSYDIEWKMEFEEGSPIAKMEVRKYTPLDGESIHRAYGLRNGEVFMEKSQAMEATYKKEKNEVWRNRFKKILKW